MNQYFPPFQGQKLVQIEVLTVKTEVCEILLIKAGKIFKKGKKTTWVGEGCSDLLITIRKGSGIWEIQPSQSKGNSAS